VVHFLLIFSVENPHKDNSSKEKKTEHEVQSASGID